MAVNIDKQEDKFQDKKKEILKLLEQKEIEIKNIEIEQKSSGRYIVDVYTDKCSNPDGTECDIKKISKTAVNKDF